MINFLQKVVDFIRTVLEHIDDFLGYINSTTLAEDTGIALGKTWLFFLDVQAPLIAEWIDKLAIYFRG